MFVEQVSPEDASYAGPVVVVENYSITLLAAQGVHIPTIVERIRGAAYLKGAVQDYAVPLFAVRFEDVPELVFSSEVDLYTHVRLHAVRQCLKGQRETNFNSYITFGNLHKLRGVAAGKILSVSSGCVHYESISLLSHGLNLVKAGERKRMQLKLRKIMLLQLSA